jgi:predicted GIY-YIG superfamily endonuclease/DNA-binding MarR family transcriptional regulator
MKIKAGIYKITCKVNGKIYIGSSADCEKRFRQHVNQLNRGKHHNSHLQRAWDKYGEENFIFEVIERINDKDKLIEREQYWIDHTKCCDEKVGYNISAVAGTPGGTRPCKYVKVATTEEARKILSSLTLREAGFLFIFIVYLDTETNAVFGDSEIGDKGAPLKLSRLAKKIGISRSGIYKITKELERKGAIKLVEAGKDRIIYVNPLIAVADEKIGDSLNHLFDYDLSVYEEVV